MFIFWFDANVGTYVLGSGPVYNILYTSSDNALGWVIKFYIIQILIWDYLAIFEVGKISVVSL